MADVHVQGYFRFVNGKNVWVPPHQQGHQAALGETPEAPGTGSKRQEPAEARGALRGPGRGQIHPARDDDGKRVFILEPHQATPPATWADPAAIATWTPGGVTPKALNGVPFKPWDTPSTDAGWQAVEGQDPELVEPAMEAGPKQAVSAGVVVEEPDGRVWVIHPTNRFGGYQGTFPKGRTDHGDGLQAAAIREAFEESGLQVEITGFLADVDRTTTRTRYYTARRMGGTPAAMGWEAQAVSLVPRSRLYEVLNSQNDHGLAEALGAGPRPAPPPQPEPVGGKGWWGMGTKSSGSSHAGALFADDDDWG